MVLPMGKEGKTNNKTKKAFTPPPLAQTVCGGPSHAKLNCMTTCDYDAIPESQKWIFTAEGQIKQGDDDCLLSSSPPTVGSCAAPTSKWNLGSAMNTTAQIKTLESPARCLKYIGSHWGIEATGMFLDTCGMEPHLCATTRCASSTLVNELWCVKSFFQ